MTNPDATPPPARLDRALENLALTFRGMTARADEVQCTCHWGGEDELARLKVPDLELDPDLLRRTWTAPDWSDHGAVLRRILPQFARSLTDGTTEHWLGAAEAGQSFARSDWQRWPAQQRAAVAEFLHAWWAHSLTDPAPTIPVYDLLVLLTEASATLTPWLTVWETTDHDTADRHLEEAAAHWQYDLLRDELPWYTSHDEDTLRTGLAAWLAGHAPPRLRARGAPEDLLHHIRLAAIPTPARWEDPYWPDRRYGF
ncbi:hypothetical protein [Streptomyces sp. NPDC059575]|uniref:hypothetical protein n=1 Tax=Streptomyces sp. NPDC059575 TaxID=3346872 RepID=UPI00368352EC